MYFDVNKVFVPVEDLLLLLRKDLEEIKIFHNHQNSKWNIKQTTSSINSDVDAWLPPTFINMLWFYRQQARLKISLVLIDVMTDTSNIEFQITQHTSRTKKQWPVKYLLLPLLLSEALQPQPILLILAVVLIQPIIELLIPTPIAAPLVAAVARPAALIAGGGTQFSWF